MATYKFRLDWDSSVAATVGYFCTFGAKKPASSDGGSGNRREYLLTFVDSTPFGGSISGLRGVDSGPGSTHLGTFCSASQPMR